MATLKDVLGPTVASYTLFLWFIYSYGSFTSKMDIVIYSITADCQQVGISDNTAIFWPLKADGANCVFHPSKPRTALCMLLVESG